MLITNVLPLSAATLAQSSSPLAPRQAHAVIKQPLIITSSDNMAPLSWIGNDGKPHGFVVDFWREWSKVTGVPISFKLVPWKHTIPLVVNGGADIHGGLFFSKERREYLAFGSHLYNMKGTIMVRKDVQVNTPEELAHVPVGVLSNGYSEYFMRVRYPQLLLVSFPSVKELADAAASGQIVALLADWISVDQHLKKLGQADNFNILKVAYNRPLHVAVRHNNDALLGIINEGMDRIPQQTRRDIFQRWVLPAVQLPVIPHATLVIAALTCLLLTALFWLQRQTLRLRAAQANQQLWLEKTQAAEQNIAVSRSKLEHYEILHAHLPNLNHATALPNEGQFISNLEQLWKSRDSFQQPASLLLLEISNTSLSPACLLRIAQTLTSNMAAPSDMPAYLGSQTYACLMSNTEANEALTVASCLELSLADLSCLNTEGPNPPLIRLGMGTLVPATHTNSSQLLTLAKNNMSPILHTATKNNA